MTEEPGAAVEHAANALFHELDRLAAYADSLEQSPNGTGPPASGDLHQQVRTERERSRELRRTVAVARERASSMVSAARTLVTDATCEFIERREWPVERNGIGMPLPAAPGGNGVPAGSAGSARLDAAGEHVAVSRAVSFIEEHATEEITVQDLASVSRVGVRHLQGLFRKHYGVSPLGYLRQARLDGAHADLRRADPTRGETVELVARRWRFTHLGRFAAAYSERFGRVPSRTLRSTPTDD